MSALSALPGASTLPATETAAGQSSGIQFPARCCLPVQTACSTNAGLHLRFMSEHALTAFGQWLWAGWDHQLTLLHPPNV